MSSQTLEVDRQTPACFDFLAQRSRYKVAYGGRDGAKSTAFADQLLMDGVEAPLLNLCAREHQTSIKQSVHRLLKNRIAALNLDSFYEIETARVKGLNATEFLFSGLRVNPSDLKSFEGVDRCWVEEAQNVSKYSWEILIPTIRKLGSEIWVSFNPELETDETYQRFVVSPPADSIVRHINWRDNPFRSRVLDDERDDCRRRDPDGYLTIWEGKCRVALEGAVYAPQMRRLVERGAVLRVPYDPSKPIHTAWDIGWGDMMFIVLFQQIGYEYRILGCIEGRHKTVAEYVKMLRDLPYLYGCHYLPHDGDNHSVTSGTSPKKQVEELMMTTHVYIVPSSGEDEQIAAVRDLFEKCVFDEKGTTTLRNRLASYKYGEHADGSSTRTPTHNLASHGAKAFATLAMGYDAGHTRPRVKVQSAGAGRESSWMAS